MIIIYSKFITLPLEKQDRIIRAALGEFGKYGYNKTSVEQVAVASGISKGMVFHYFGTKKGLYEYLVKYCNEYLDKYFIIPEEIMDKYDYIEFFRKITKIKLKAYTGNPQVFEFITMLYLKPENMNVSESILNSLTTMFKKRDDILSRVNQKEDVDYFRSDIDVNDAKKYISWVIDGYQRELMAEIGNTTLSDFELDDTWDEFDRIMLDLKKIFYINNKGGHSNVDD